mmetsp:Transcript_25596/g.44675  ORF Transcript_25596/g.44675 Transcript_25596/m.44675 type:complete len:178 (-) Transcript_25596:158-691(-)
MRPTLLGFRSPKERTPDAYSPTATYDGRVLNFSPRRVSRLSTSLPRAKRFSQYETVSRVTGFRVGPGAYENDNLAIAKSRVRGGPVYSQFHANKQTHNNGYFMVGDHMVFDAHYVPSSMRTTINDVFCKVDATSVLNRTAERPFTSSSTLQQRKSSSATPRRNVLKSPYLASPKISD